MVNIADHPELIVKQEVEHLEAFSGFETENQYSVMTPSREKLLHAAEESGFLGRLFLKSHRPLTLRVVDGQGQVAIEASRDFFWFFSHLHVRDGDGRNLGSLRRQFSIMVRRFTVEDADGRPVAEVRGPMLRPNTFTVYKQDTPIARITKRWSGLLKEAVTDADTFRLELLDRNMEPDSALIVLATAFAIDLDFFES